MEPIHPHCGPNGFSPPAPLCVCHPELCYVPPPVVNEVPEPSTILLIGLAVCVVLLIRFIRG